MPHEIVPETLHHLLQEGSTLALLDVREHGEYNAAHIPGSTSLPRRLLEWEVARLLPFKGVQVVLCDDDGRRARLAARTLERFGYTRVAVLDGGVNGWAAAGLPTEWGINVISKDFGERVEVEHHVPTVTAQELHRRVRQGERLVILDARTPEEYRRVCIPGARSVPGGELALRIADIASAAPDATVVVHCAGRTRSIIGARILQRMGLRNAVSLKNGTAGWALAGLELEHGADRVELPEPSPEGRAAAEAFARRVAAEDGVRPLSVAEAQALMERRDRETVYLIDVRTEAEYALGHIPGFWWFPGGQAVQRADDVAPVRNASLLFACDGVTRAFVTASWYRQMGFPNVYALEGGTSAWAAAGLPLETGIAAPAPLGLAEAAAQVRPITHPELHTAVNGPKPPLIVFVETSRDFAQGHVPGSRWIPRGSLELQIEGLAPERDRTIVVTDRDGRNATLAGAALRELGYADVRVLAGGLEAWRANGLPVEQGLSGVMTPPNDVLLMGTDRGSAEMIHYLRWEEALGKKYEAG